MRADRSTRGPEGHFPSMRDAASLRRAQPRRPRAVRAAARRLEPAAANGELRRCRPRHRRARSASLGEVRRQQHRRHDRQPHGAGHRGARQRPVRLLGPRDRSRPGARTLLRQHHDFFRGGRCAGRLWARVLRHERDVPRRQSRRRLSAHGPESERRAGPAGGSMPQPTSLPTVIASSSSAAVTTMDAAPTSTGKPCTSPCPTAATTASSTARPRAGIAGRPRASSSSRAIAAAWRAQFPAEAPTLHLRRVERAAEAEASCAPKSL